MRKLLLVLLTSCTYTISDIGIRNDEAQDSSPDTALETPVDGAAFSDASSGSGMDAGVHADSSNRDATPSPSDAAIQEASTSDAAAIDTSLCRVQNGNKQPVDVHCDGTGASDFGFSGVTLSHMNYVTLTVYDGGGYTTNVTCKGKAVGCPTGLACNVTLSNSNYYPQGVCMP